MASNPVRTIVGACFVLVITVIGLEVAVRVLGYSERHIYDPIYTSFDRTDDIPYIHKANLTGARARGLAVINTDSLGLRTMIAGTTYGAKQTKEYRIAIVGDSWTFGEGVTRTEDTFAQVLEDTLNRRQQTMTVKVFNYGASAYSVKEMAATLQYRMLDIQPDLVVMAIIPSDFNLDRTPTIDDSGYLVDQNLSHFIPSASMVRRALRQIHLLYVLRDIGLRWFFKPLDITEVLSRGDIPESYGYVRQFKEIAEQRGIPYVVVLLPIMQHTWGGMTDRLLRDTVTHLDMSFLLQEFTEEQFMASRFDPHPSAAVHRLIGKALAEYVMQNQLKKLSGPTY